MIRFSVATGPDCLSNGGDCGRWSADDPTNGPMMERADALIVKLERFIAGVLQETSNTWGLVDLDPEWRMYVDEIQERPCISAYKWRGDGQRHFIVKVEESWEDDDH